MQVLKKVWDRGVELLRNNKEVATTGVVTVGALAANDAGATGTVYDTIAAAADYSGVTTGVGTVAVALAGLFIVIAGATILLHFLKKR